MRRSISQVLLFVAACTLLGSCTPETIEVPVQQTLAVVPDHLRPPVMGRNAGVSAGHPLTSAAALEILQDGGNAFDAGVAALLVGGVVEQDLYSLGGEALILVYPQSERRVTSIVGQGWAARGATIEWYRARNKNLNGYGLDPAVVPGAIHGALTVLERWGTMSFEQVAARAIEHAELGFPLRTRTAFAIQREKEFIDQWPDNRSYWYRPDGTMYFPGELMRLPTLADTLKKMVEAERAAAAQGRAAGVAAARDPFLPGRHRAGDGGVSAGARNPVRRGGFLGVLRANRRAHEHHLQGLHRLQAVLQQPGTALLQALNILENFDLRGMGHNSAAYLHTLVEALKLAYADRDSVLRRSGLRGYPGGRPAVEGLRRRAGRTDRHAARLANLRGRQPVRF